VRVPEKGFERWAARNPRVRGPVVGAVSGLPLGLIMAIAFHDWLAVLAVPLVFAVFGTWRAGAIQRALAGQRNTPYEA
jgi:hypothetical protein